MASRFNTLLHGEAAEAAAVLSGEAQAGERGVLLELRAALTNALNRIAKLENLVDGELVSIAGSIERMRDDIGTNATALCRLDSASERLEAQQVELNGRVSTIETGR